MAYGDWKAQFWAFAGVGIQFESGGFSEDVFCYPAPLLHVGGQVAGTLEDFFVQERNTHFQGMGHAHAIGFLEDVSGEPVSKIYFLHSVCVV